MHTRNLNECRCVSKTCLENSAVEGASETVTCSQTGPGLEITCSQSLFCKRSEFQTGKDRLKTLVAQKAK